MGVTFMLAAKLIVCTALFGGVLAVIDATWALPLNTLLLIILSTVNLYRTRKEEHVRRKLEKVETKVDALPDPIPGGQRATDPPSKGV